MDIIKDISIKNFKSLEEVKIQGCKTFNLFIGRPNVGKSNINSCVIPPINLMDFDFKDFVLKDEK